MKEILRHISITSALLVFFLAGITIVTIYNFFGVGGPIAEGKLSIYFTTIYVDPENKAALAILIANTGTVDLTVNSIKIGEEVCELPVKGMIGSNKIKARDRGNMEIPLKGTYIIGGVYDISIETDPPATYEPLQVTAAYREW